MLCNQISAMPTSAMLSSPEPTSIRADEVETYEQHHTLFKNVHFKSELILPG